VSQLAETSETLINDLKTLTSNKNSDNIAVISTKQLEDIRLIQSLYSTNSTSLTPDVKQTIMDLAKSQVNLVVDGDTPPSQDLLNLLDFSLQLSSE